ncbi:Hemolysin-like protein (fragment) [Bartonella clarridgeiae 73]|uniref:Hemolysin-like protein n=1 Tax=Bartonella clarridgeiae (strain CCUG 45776 / CIP 104772 / 73) TaxID=696125 RepID=E6YGX4_BARC7
MFSVITNKITAIDIDASTGEFT